ncbi:hypothetical protein, partial [Rhodopirellula bahusiensis]|uniref:hypothetical protein n=1 Tax=Rhodopirellula bahusiensis TaxID=2014065 RepID=UPI003298A658
SQFIRRRIGFPKAEPSLIAAGSLGESINLDCLQRDKQSIDIQGLSAFQMRQFVELACASSIPQRAR